ncbi:hypothetical protein ZIOFF_034355 [Zingiber officinale]|uniref:Myb/SANT-like domain-containing protein n=1 Tax=Zingiber officinale TaxID=94328 RepID=A0A8J5LDF4_ZINOF|nr:hypothetical protein ZIOFF_034355 [Zingiber officinale]
MPQMQFIYVLPGWECSAHDSRALCDAISRSSGLKVPQDGGFKNNYMVAIRKIMIQKLPTFTKSVNHIESRIKNLKRKFHAINEMCRQSGYTWNDVEKKIACEETWYLEWIKNHNDAKSLYNVSFPYFSELEMVYDKDRATSLVAEDPMMVA